MKVRDNLIIVDIYIRQSFPWLLLRNSNLFYFSIVCTTDIKHIGQNIDNIIEEISIFPSSNTAINNFKPV